MNLGEAKVAFMPFVGDKDTQSFKSDSENLRPSTAGKADKEGADTTCGAIAGIYAYETHIVRARSCRYSPVRGKYRLTVQPDCRFEIIKTGYDDVVLPLTKHSAQPVAFNPRQGAAMMCFSALTAVFTGVTRSF